MQIKHTILEYQTKGEFEIRDITDQVEEFVKQSSIKNGIINIQSFHTTATVVINENEPLLLKDIKLNLEKIAPSNVVYNHDNFAIRTVNMCEGECENGRSHCRALYLPTSVTLNLNEGKIQFGRWQRILFIELDRSRPRKVQVQILGE